MKFPTRRIDISMPMDWFERLFARFGTTDKPLKFRKGARYQLNGEWFEVEKVLATGLVMRLCNRGKTIREDP